MWCTHAPASVTFHNTSVLTYIPKPKHILSFCITSELSGWKNYELKGDYQSCLLQESVERVSMRARLCSKLPPLGCIRDPPLLRTHTHSLATNPVAPTPLQYVLKHTETPSVFAANQHPAWSRPGIANILEARFKYHNSFSANIMCHSRLFCQR